MPRGRVGAKKGEQGSQKDAFCEQESTKKKQVRQSEASSAAAEGWEANLVPQIWEKVAQELRLPQQKVQVAVRLLDRGNTVPFIARYRKEATGQLDEEQLRNIQARVQSLETLRSRKLTVLETIAKQGKLERTLEQSILSAETLQRVEDLYLPFKPKRSTRASTARDAGLEPLAVSILKGHQAGRLPSLSSLASTFVNASKEVGDVQAALAGARDIIAELAIEQAEVREEARRLLWKKGTLVCGAAKRQKGEEGKENQKDNCAVYHNFASAVSKLRPHQTLAINRGEAEKALKVSLVWANGTVPAVQRMAERLLLGEKALPEDFSAEVRAAVEDGWKRLLQPAVERDIRAKLSAAAEAHAIETFGANLKKLLLQPPLQGRIVMGVDPAFRTGCKLAVCDPTGKLLETATMYPHPPASLKQREAAHGVFVSLLQKHQVEAVAIGNGQASRETELFVAQALKQHGEDIGWTIVSEAGASVYSASELATKELPSLDVALRGAVSIARRLQDPLAELVKIDPQSIGVGLNQHDVQEKKLREALDGVVESAVSSVGVNLNTASPALLSHVAGLNKSLANRLVEQRDQEGRFETRQALLKVKGLGKKTFEQCAGFLRIAGGPQPLDNTPIHPESYSVVDRLIAELVVPGGSRKKRKRSLDLSWLRPQAAEAKGSVKGLAQKLQIGEPTLRDILDALEAPGRDPREDLPPVRLRRDVLSMSDLKEGMELSGTVRNVVAFGAFVDIGVDRDALLHVSGMGRSVKDPHQAVAVGDQVEVRIQEVDRSRGRISVVFLEPH